ncbi:transcriptional regulator GcvA [Parvularcula sp. ZS-1/3]|uniref:Transcriptional regulator GcvA n=1 Tax=Parvularcula mediterranea TaxID=2732508 RepID=A0A7Y3RKI9_9PROT|nr:transcriptional regulator GcvA [Parvularcula mediterranea]NNU15767.1 transcriptional regulator GcvA [Parvularcula mediterranea]
MRKLPPLNALRAFEAAARHLSFSRAADELSVTPGAISQQMRILEGWLGSPLFKRDPKGLQLTEAGIAALPHMREGFDRLATGTRLMQAGTGPSKITVSVAPSFASKWLVPRLDQFQEQRPDLDVYVHADMEVVDFATADVDVAIRFGRGNYEGLMAERLLTESIVPVCAPGLPTEEAPLEKPEDLANHTLIHDDSERDGVASWAMWLRAAGVEAGGERGPRFNQSSLVIEAAVAGKGVALARYALAVADLEAARLVVPFGHETPTDFAYWVVYPEAKAALPDVKAFIDWVKNEARPLEKHR